MGVNLFNSEGYLDPTAYEALTNIEREKKKRSQGMGIEIKKEKEQNVEVRKFSTEFDVIGGAK